MSADDRMLMLPYGNQRRAQMIMAPAVLAVVLLIYALLVWEDARGLTEIYGAGPAALVLAGRITALWAALLFMAQYVLSARVPWLDRMFGLDRLLHFHRWLGVAAVILASMHPFLIYGSKQYALGAFAWSRWPELLGALVLVLLWLIVCTSIWRAFLRIDYQTWRMMHLLTFAIVVLATIHAWRLGSDFHGVGRVLWLILLAGYVGLFLGDKVYRAHSVRHRAYRVTAIDQANHNTVDIAFAPSKGSRLAFAPGQFAFVRLVGSEVHSEEHPFTISSSPLAVDDDLHMTIKASGDFTATLPRVKEGDEVRVTGPFGRFSYPALNAPAVLMIAGGVGITPMLSMLRTMAIERDTRPIHLIWTYRRPDDSVFDEEFVRLHEAVPNLKLDRVITRGPEGVGRLNQERLTELLTEDDQKADVLLCGPSSMMRNVSHDLHELGIARQRIHQERFCF